LVVRNNFIHDNKAICFFIKDGLVNDVVLENNVIVRNDTYGIQVYDVNGMRVVNNTIMDNLGGVLFRGRVSDLELVNNVMSSLSATPETTFAAADFNYVAERKVSHEGQHDLEDAPEFVDPEELDYQLTRRSSAVNAGTDDGAPPVDHAGRARRGPVDVGAYEYRP